MENIADDEDLIRFALEIPIDGSVSYVRKSCVRMPYVRTSSVRKIVCSKEFVYERSYVRNYR
jgi:hypothetical protein